MSMTLQHAALLDAAWQLTALEVPVEKKVHLES